MTDPSFRPNPKMGSTSDPSTKSGSSGSRFRSRVLLVEKESRDAQDIRTHLGGFCRIVQARDGQEALSTIRDAQRAGERFDLAIVGCLAPYSGGRMGLGDEIQQIDPQLRVVSLSLFAQTSLCKDGESGPFAAYYQLPYEMEQFVARARERLDTQNE